MGIAKKEVEYSKELDDALVLVVELVKGLKAKKDLSAIAAEELPLLLAAISGVEQIPAEVKGNMPVALSTVGSRLGELVGVLLA